MDLVGPWCMFGMCLVLGGARSCSCSQVIQGSGVVAERGMRTQSLSPYLASVVMSERQVLGACSGCVWCLVVLSLVAVVKSFRAPGWLPKGACAPSAGC